MKSNHQCRVCGRHLEAEWNAAPPDSPERAELQRQMDNGQCYSCTRQPPNLQPRETLALYLVQQAHKIWEDIRWLTQDRHNWAWYITPEAHRLVLAHPWVPPDPDDPRYPPGYAGPIRLDDGTSSWTLFGIPLRESSPGTQNHNEIELRIRR